MTWNCKGFKRIVHDLDNISSSESVDFVFILEAWLFQPDVPVVMKEKKDLLLEEI